MTTVLIFLLAMAGFAAIALSMGKHHRDILGVTPGRASARSLRATGWLALSASLALSIRAEGLSIGIVQWTAFLTVAALTVALLLTYKDKWWRT